MIEISNNVMCFGDSAFIRNVTIPTCDEISKLALKYPVTEPETSVVGRPKAVAAEIAGLVGVAVFIGSWAATKLLDEVYEKIKPMLHENLTKFIGEGRNGKAYAIATSITSKKTNNTILIVSVSSTGSEVLINESQTKAVLKMAIDYQVRCNQNNQVFLYRIENGKCDIDPIICTDIQSALGGLRRNTWIPSKE